MTHEMTQVQQLDSATKYSAAIRSARSYSFEVLFQIDGNGDFENTSSVDLTNVIRQISRGQDQPVMTSFSVSDYSLKHAPGFVEADRQTLAIGAPEIERGSARYLTLVPNDTAVALFGSNAVTLESLPPKVTFTLGFLNPISTSDYVLANPNTPTNYGTTGQIAMASQQLEYAVFRFRMQTQFL